MLTIARAVIEKLQFNWKIRRKYNKPLEAVRYYNRGNRVDRIEKSNKLLKDVIIAYNQNEEANLGIKMIVPFEKVYHIT